MKNFKSKPSLFIAAIILTLPVIGSAQALSSKQTAALHIQCVAWEFAQHTPGSMTTLELQPTDYNGRPADPATANHFEARSKTAVYEAFAGDGTFIVSITEADSHTRISSPEADLLPLEDGGFPTVRSQLHLDNFKTGAVVGCGYRQTVGN